MTMQCVLVEDGDSRWDPFVTSQSAGTFFHLWAWREVLKRSFGYEPLYLCVEDAGQLQGILPLFLVKSLLFGRSLVGMPLGVYGGIVAKAEPVARMLLDRAKEIAQAHRTRYLELRGNPYQECPPLDFSSKDSWSRKDLYVSFIKNIDPTDDVNFAQVPRKQRRMIRQGQKHGLRAVFDNRRLREFYAVYAESVRNLGTPVYSYRYFEILIEIFGPACKLMLVDYRGKIVAGVLTFFYKDQVMPYYGGASREYFNLAPNDFMYWELMCFGARHGYKIFDFGRSKEGAGSYSFKRHWGFEPRSLPYWYYSVAGKNLPDTSPLNPKLQWAISIWRSLPLKLTMALGPHIVRHIP